MNYDAYIKNYENDYKLWQNKLQICEKLIDCAEKNKMKYLNSDISEIINNSNVRSRRES
jgi:hypothetical protein